MSVDIYIYIYPAGGYGSPRADASPVLPNSGEMSKPVDELQYVSRLEINNVSIYLSIVEWTAIKFSSPTMMSLIGHFPESLALKTHIRGSTSVMS